MTEFTAHRWDQKTRKTTSPQYSTLHLCQRQALNKCTLEMFQLLFANSSVHSHLVIEWQPPETVSSRGQQQLGVNRSFPQCLETRDSRGNKTPLAFTFNLFWVRELGIKSSLSHSEGCWIYTALCVQHKDLALKWLPEEQPENYPRLSFFEASILKLQYSPCIIPSGPKAK